MDIINYSKIKKLSKQVDDNKLKTTQIERNVSDISTVISQLNPNQETKQSISGYGILSLPKTAANSPVSLTIKGRTWTNRAGKGDTSPQTVENLDSTKTYLLINSLGKNVIVDTVDTATPKKLTGATSFSFEWTEGKIALYELSTAEAALTEAVLGAKYHYVDSTKSTISGRIKRVGKNLNNQELELGSINVDTGANESNDTRVRSKGYIRLNGVGKHYLKLFDATKQIAIRCYDGNRNYVGHILTFTTKGVFEPLANTIYIRYFILDSTDKNAKVMVTEGSQEPTIYEPYAEENAYYSGTYRSLPNGTKDEVSLSEGKLIKAVGEKAIQVGDITGVYNTLSGNLSMVYITKPIDCVQLRDNITTTTLGIYDRIPWSSYDDVKNIGKYVYNTGAQRIQLLVALGTTLAQAKDMLTGAELTYQLANPIVTKIPAQMLTAGANHTVYWLPELADAGIYDGGISILNQELPIKALKKISKIDFMTGAETELNIATAVIAADKKSFTHPDLTNDDIVFFEYEYPSELTTVPEMTVGYLDSRYVVEDTENGKLYSWKIVSANGVASIVLTEVQ